MRRRSKLRTLGQAAAALALIGVTMLIVSGPSGAAPPTFAGWWTSTNPGVTLVPVPAAVPPGGGPYGTPSDVPPGGFEVANVPGDTSIAAIGYATEGATVTQVVLQQTPNSATVPGSQVQACILTGTGIFTPASAAPISQAPPYDCNHPVPGVVDPSAGSVSFPVSQLVHDDYLGIAIVAVGTSRMVFNAPDQNTVRIQAASPSSDLSGFDAGAFAAGSSTSSAPDTFAAPASSATAPQDLAAPTSPAANAAPEAAPAPAQAPVAGATLVAVTQPTHTIGIGSAAVGALLVLAFAVAGLGLSSRLVHDDPSASPG